MPNANNANDLVPNEDLEKLFTGIQEGDEQALTQFWNLHYDQLVVLARRKMGGVNLRIVDEEDIALSTINSFYRGLTEKRYDLRCNNEMWKLLATIVIRKIAKQRKKHFTQKRGGGQVRGESFFTTGDSSDVDSRTGGIGQFSIQENTHELEVDFMDTCKKLCDELTDETTRKIALLSMEGFSVDEIAEQLGCVRRTIERKLKRIREKWSTEL